jgi:hypothetical protein
MLWMITEDKINERSHAVGMCGDALCASLDATRVPVDQRAGIIAECDTEFRLLDDDDEVYYLGVCKDLAGANQDDAFEPMDCFMHTCGTTQMEYRPKGSTGAWEAL